MAANGTTVDFDAAGDRVVSPAFLAHVVLRTANIEPMVDFYTKFLGGHISYRNNVAAFITYDEEHHRIAIIKLPGMGPKEPKSSGLEHIAFTFHSLETLLLAYRQRKHAGIEPVWCVNHGPTTSMYYKDPDRNVLETQVDNFKTIEETNTFLHSPQFAENFVGTDFDPEDLIVRLKNGESDASLKKRIEIGPREFPDLDSM